MDSDNCEVLIIGGGFYGLYIANHFASKGFSVVLCEQSGQLMGRASYVNQARVHNGYHYPRSMLTAMRSRASLPVFCDEFSSAIESDFDSYYLLGKTLSNITSSQFKAFCQRIDAPCEQAPGGTADFFNKHYVEDVYITKEYVFDAHIIRDLMLEKARKSGVDIRLSTAVRQVSRPNDNLVCDIEYDGKMNEVRCQQVFNCTYSGINALNESSSLDIIPLKHQLTEICLVNVPEEIKDKAFTMMCGPFFSLMPFPTSGDKYSFTHVRYTPHLEWQEGAGEKNMNAADIFNQYERKSAWLKMKKDASRYMPIVNEFEYCESLWEVKTVLPASKKDDSRPIFFKFDHGLKGFHCVMGGKIDNVYDAIRLISLKGLDKR